jgi:hypothetical protein
MKETLGRRTMITENIGDIYDGNVYRQHVINNQLGSFHQLSYSLCTDGVR